MKTVDDINHEAQIDLRERVKELSCLYNIAHLASQKDIAMGELLKGVVEGLPAAWLYPEAACARIVFDGHSHSTSNYRRLRHRQSVPVAINGRLRGYIEVGYPDMNEVAVRQQKVTCKHRFSHGDSLLEGGLGLGTCGVERGAQDQQVDQLDYP